MGLQLYTTQLGLRWANDAGVRGSGTSEETCKAALAAASAALLGVGGFQADERWFKKKKLFPRTVSYKKSVFTDRLGNMHMVHMVWWLPQKLWRVLLNGKTLHQNSNTGVQKFSLVYPSHSHIINSLIPKRVQKFKWARKVIIKELLLRERQWLFSCFKGTKQTSKDSLS